MNWPSVKTLGRRPEFFLVIVSIALYVPAIGWGLPHANHPEFTRPWSPDDIAPLAPLTEIHNLFVKAEADRFLAYPLMHHMILSVAYGPYLLYLLATGALSNPSPVFPFGLQDPIQSLQVLSLIARLVAVLMAAGTVVAAYHVARSLWDRTRGILAGVFVMLLYPMFYYSRTGNVDGPALFWGAAGLAVYAAILRHGYSIRRAIWLGVFAAMSAGTKDQGAILFLLMPLVLLPLHYRRVSRSGIGVTRSSFWRPPIATLLAGLAVYLFSSGFLFRPERYFAHLRFILRIGPNSAVYFGHPADLAGYSGLLLEFAEKVIRMMSIGLLFFSLLGILICMRRDRLALAFLVPAISLVLIVVVPTRYLETRFLLPVGFILACFAAYPIGAGLRSEFPAVRASFVFLTLAVILLPLLYGLDLTYVMRNDSRYDAAEWLNGRLQAGDRVEFFGPYAKLPHLRDGIELAQAVEFLGTNREVQYSPEEIEAMAQAISERTPDIILVMPDHSSSPEYPYGTTNPPELYALLADGTLGYERVAVFETPPLLKGITRPSLDHPIVNPRIQVFAHSTWLDREELLSAKPSG